LCIKNPTIAIENAYHLEIFQKHQLQIEGMKTNELKKIKEFLYNGRTVITPDWQQRHVLTAWSWSTLISYNAGVKKFHRLMKALDRRYTLPLTAMDIETFCFLAGRTDIKNSSSITAVTLTKYLFPLQAWHQFHNVVYPETAKGQIKLILKACAKKDAEVTHKKEKRPILLKHLLHLVGGEASNEESTIKRSHARHFGECVNWRN
jgi:hypothetical protein